MKNCILIIDDDDMIAIQLEGILGKLFGITHVDNGVDGLFEADKLQPDLVLLDVEMPGLDGYSVCRKLKGKASTAHIPVMFVSAHVDEDDRLAGYDAGGDDYITKPFAPDELRSKIAVMLRNVQKKEELSQKAESATTMAHLAMSSADDTRYLLSFLREIVGFNGFGEIAEAALRHLQAYDLNASIQIRANSGTLSCNNQGFCSPLEESVLSNMASCGRIVDLGRRSAFNFPHVSIIVSNMPDSSSDDYGRYKDCVATMAEMIDIRMGSLELMLEAINRGDTLLGLLHRNATTLREIETRQNSHRQQSSDILNQLVSDIEDSFYFLGLTDSQELHLQNLARDAVDKAQALYGESIETDAIMKSLGSGLDDAMLQELQGAADASEQVNRIELF